MTIIQQLAIEAQAPYNKNIKIDIWTKQGAFIIGLLKHMENSNIMLNIRYTVPFVELHFLLTPINYN